MFSNVIFVYLIVSALSFGYFATGEGEACFKDGITGICTNARRCKTAKEDIKIKRDPQICNHVGNDPMVCCSDPLLLTTTTPKSEIDQRQGPKTTAGIVPIRDGKIDTTTSTDVKKKECSAGLSAGKTGQKAFNKCIEYQEQILYPCKIESKIEISDFCNRDTLLLNLGRNPSAAEEFTHLVMLSYGNETKSISWLCTGSIISDQYILTSGYCATSRDQGEVKYVLVGGLLWEPERNKNITELYRVKRVVRNPSYEAPVLYHDIALLELETKLNLSPVLLPACLHVGNPVEDETGLYTTRIYSTDNRKGDPDLLDRVSLEKLPHENCSSNYPSSSTMKAGVDIETQMCYIKDDADSCLGDKGNPILMDNPDVNCMYLILGVTSLRPCASPGLFTRVAPYIPWIESVVWP